MARTSAWLDLITARRAQTADEVPPNNYSRFGDGVVFAKTRSHSGGQSTLHTTSQLGKKNKWCVLGELGQSTASGLDSVWVPLTHGHPPPLPAPSAPILGLSATHTGLTDALTLPSTKLPEMCEILRKDELFDIAHLHAGKREQRGRGGQAPCEPQGLKPFSFWESLELTVVGINFAQSVGKTSKTAQASKYIHVISTLTG